MTAPALVFVVGSPPQVRGKRRAKKVASHIQRITPAGAGKTFFKLRHASRDKDHPRRCGENPPPPRASCAIRGSPPQVRGKRGGIPIRTPKKRITPAGAGKTKREQSDQPKSRDHPRRCGENRWIFYPKIFFQGSPPQVRGKRLRKHTGTYCGRITPAGAGKTMSRTSWGIRPWDHPRRCGENASRRTGKR